MSTKDEKYLVLRGKNKDIYFIQKRVSKKVASIIGTDFIKKSLETSDINVAIEKRDSILEELIAHEQSIPANNTPDTQDSPDIDSDINPKYEENGKNTFDVKKIVDIKSIKLPSQEEFVERIDSLVPISIVIGALIVAFMV
jgi:hypothetical protein|tara:strand:+ start:5246 stop:5668 length:423 start_codon:yes stop_codon:yes gene_type:complete